MNKILNQKVPFFFSFFIAFFLLFTDTVLIDNMLKENNVLGASTKSKVERVQKQKKNSVGVNLNKPDVTVHVSKVKNATLEIKKVAKIEKEAGKVEVGEEIIKSADEISYASVDNIGSLDEVDTRPAWKSFLFGPDYKNLGKIRSNLVQTRNQIRKIEKTLEKGVGEEDASILRSRLTELEQERLKIYDYIDQRDDGFSLFGWLAKLMSGYNKNIEEEEDLGQEVEIIEESENEVVEDEETDDLDESVGNENLEKGDENTVIVEETEKTEGTGTNEIAE